MCSQLPELCQSDLVQVHDIATLAHGRLCVRPIRNCRAQWQDESTEVLVQSEQLQHLPGHFGFDVDGCIFAALFLPIRIGRGCRDLFCIYVANFEDVEWYTALVSPARPLWIQPSRLLVLVDVDGLVQLIELILLPPVFGVLELSEGIFGDKFPGT